jgi:hypothetical protein
MVDFFTPPAGLSAFIWSVRQRRGGKSSPQVQKFFGEEQKNFGAVVCSPDRRDRRDRIIVFLRRDLQEERDYVIFQGISLGSLFRREERDYQDYSVF